ncbi:hypothetical protein [Streptomyces sp. WG-D5]
MSGDINSRQSATRTSGDFREAVASSGNQARPTLPCTVYAGPASGIPLIPAA